MRRLSITRGNKTINLDINKYKNIISYNYEESYLVYNCIKYYFSNVKESEYSECNHNTIKIKIDDRNIEIKKTNFFEVSDQYDLMEDFKLSAKSLSTQYLTVLLEKIDYYDTIHSINYLLSSLSEELSNDLEMLKIEIPDFNSKKLIKLLEISLEENELKQNQFDLTYEKRIIIQLKMIEEIINSKNKEINLILLSLPIITNNIYKQLEKMKNTLFIIFTPRFDIKFEFEDYFFIGNQISIDLANENDIYYEVCELSLASWSLMEGKEYMREYLEGKDTHQTRFIKSLIE